MFVLIAYDVNTINAAGKRRLRLVAKECVNYGQRVQQSVFECVADAVTFAKIKNKLLALIDESVDSLRFYYLGNNYSNRVEHFGAKPSYDAEGFLSF